MNRILPPSYMYNNYLKMPKKKKKKKKNIYIYIFFIIIIMIIIIQINSKNETIYAKIIYVIISDKKTLKGSK
jgi:dolichol kinase